MADDLRLAVGLISGTSMDGMDAALLRTDGRLRMETGPALTLPYPVALTSRLMDDPTGRAAALEQEVDRVALTAIHALMERAGLPVSALDVVGYHGQTILHAPQRRLTWQLGDSQRLATALGVPVVGRFRQADVAAGGQGAPFVPLYHQALAGGLEPPLMVLNVGGVANLTWIGPPGSDPIACDTGPGNAPVDDLVRRATGRPYDDGGALALAGRVDEALLTRLLDHPFFAAPPPKSLDRNAFDTAAAAALPLADAAATLIAFSAAAVACALAHLPARPRRCLVCGGGRLNIALMNALEARLAMPVEAVEAVGWQGDALEAQAFGYLAVRTLEGLPLSLPSTTGVPRPMPGGEVFGPLPLTVPAAVALAG